MRTKPVLGRTPIGAALAASLALWATLVCATRADEAFIPRLINSSTIPANGDINPYGVVFVPKGFPGGGTIAAGDVLVSNFNNSNNSQGTGTTIVELSPQGPIAPPNDAVTFFTSSKPGLSTALGALRAGFVLVGNLPTELVLEALAQRVDGLPIRKPLESVMAMNADIATRFSAR